jgi:hypothetical protein
MTPVMCSDISGYAPESNSFVSLVFKEGYKTPDFNYYFFDFGAVQYATKGRLFSDTTTPVELYTLTTYGGFRNPLFSTSIGGRLNFKHFSIYNSMSLTATSIGFATKDGYGSVSVGIVGQSWWDAGIGFSIELNNAYLNVKAPLTTILVVAAVVTTSPVLATAAVAVGLVSLINNDDSGGEYYE